MTYFVPHFRPFASLPETWRSSLAELIAPQHLERLRRLEGELSFIKSYAAETNPVVDCVITYLEAALELPEVDSSFLLDQLASVKPTFSRGDLCVLEKVSQRFHLNMTPSEVRRLAYVIRAVGASVVESERFLASDRRCGLDRRRHSEDSHTE